MAGFNPRVFQWARESAGLGLEEAARALHIVPASLAAIEQGTKEPSRTNLSNMARAYHRSLLALYLATPPKKGDRGEDFRTVAADRTVQAEADIDALVRDLRARQSLVRSVLEAEDDVQRLSFIASAKMQQGAAHVCRSIEMALGITRQDLRAQANADQAFSLLRRKVEQLGIFVLLIGNLGSHHSAIPVEAFRGFAISDDVAPFVVINDGDAKAAWSFTLLHELAHLWLGITGVSAGIPDRQVESFCNDVAGSFLLPEADLASINIAGLDLDAQALVIDAHANRWRLSRSMVAYGLFKAGRISRDEWRALDNELRARWAVERRREKERRSESAGGPNYYVVRRHRLGEAMLEFAHRAMDAGTLSPAKAAKVLGVKPRSVYPLLSLAA
ncbi:MAG TPA: XRE family transcriptional regulator [Burkholderiaceae bacterium]|jgi:Zn-dependent peptidase ImmA (M78 family)/transcriptional regulator with XRE-family HTH domain